MWWSVRDSNPRHHGCDPCALPAELTDLTESEIKYSSLRRGFQAVLMRPAGFAKIGRRDALLLHIPYLVKLPAYVPAYVFKVVAYLPAPDYAEAGIRYAVSGSGPVHG